MKSKKTQNCFILTEIHRHVYVNLCVLPLCNLFFCCIHYKVIVKLFIYFCVRHIEFEYNELCCMNKIATEIGV